MDPYQFRNPDGSLRLDELLGARYVKHYVRILESSNEEFAAMQLAMAVPGTDYQPSWREASRQVTEDGWCVVPEGVPERHASPCTALALLPEVCWDVCGYYQTLGVHWRASKAQIARAAVELDPGRLDRRVAYATSQLLDPVIRRAYDLMPLGGLFLGDRDVREMIERRAAMEAARRTSMMQPGEMTAQEEVLSEWGFEKGVSEEEARERLGGFRPGHSEDELGSSLGDWERNWGWFRLADPYDDPYGASGADVRALEHWQALIAASLEAHGVRISFSIGTWPGNGVRHWRDGNKSCIFFIGGQVTRQKAHEAVRGYLAQG